MIGFDPGETVDVTLKAHTKKAANARPVFVYRFLTCRETLKVEKLLKAAREEKDQEKKVDLLVNATSVGMVNWRNVPGDFDSKRLPDLVTAMQLWELAHNAINATMLKEIDLGKSDSPSDTLAGDGASPAIPTAGTAENSAPNSIPSTSPATPATANATTA